MQLNGLFRGSHSAECIMFLLHASHSTNSVYFSCLPRWHLQAVTVEQLTSLSHSCLAPALRLQHNHFCLWLLNIWGKKKKEEEAWFRSGKIPEKHQQWMWIVVWSVWLERAQPPLCWPRANVPFPVQPIHALLVCLSCVLCESVQWAFGGPHVTLMVFRDHFSSAHAR